MRLRAALVLASCLLASLAHALPEHTWVVAIGNNYGDADELGLRHAERDARELATVFDRLGPVSARRTLVLLDEEAPSVRQALVEVNATIRARAGDGQPTALVVLYSGHADAGGLHLSGTRLPFEELRGLVRGSPASMRILVVDACRSGGVSRVKGMARAKTFEIDLDDRTAAEGVAIITSSAAGESSQESDRLRASFFSHHLVNALRGAADRNRDGRVTLNEAYAYTYEQTLRSSGRTMNLQHPTYAFDVKGRGEVVLSKPGASDRRSGRLQLAEPATYLLTEESEGSSVVAEVSPAAPGATLVLPARRYFVQQRLPREYREYEVTLALGEHVVLADHPYRSVRYDQLVRKRGATTRRSVHGFQLLGGGRGELLAGEGAAPQLVVGYSADLPWFSTGVRVRASTVESHGADRVLTRRHDELGVGLVLQRFVDLRHLSVAFGVLVEGAMHRQVFAEGRDADDRSTASVAFGALLSAERHLTGGLALRLEGGPLSTVFEQHATEDGVTTETELATPVTWWAAAGVVWRL